MISLDHRTRLAFDLQSHRMQAGSGLCSMTHLYLQGWTMQVVPLQMTKNHWMLTLKVGSSFKKRLRARLILPPESRDLGRRASDMTGSGTFIDVMLYLQQSYQSI